MRKLFLLLCLITFSASATNDATLNAEQTIRYQQLTQELRCLVCQNEDLADSDAPLAKDLRKQIRNSIQAGKSNSEITQYLTERYGEFILFKPSLSKKNLVLWVWPFALLIIGVIALGFALAWHRKKSLNKSTLTAEEKNRLEQLLK